MTYMDDDVIDSYIESGLEQQLSFNEIKDMLGRNFISITDEDLFKRIYRIRRANGY